MTAQLIRQGDFAPLIPLQLIEQEIPIFIFDGRVPAGFPSPAEDYEASRIDLQAFLVKHPAATWLIRVRGDSMQDVGIRDGAILIVDGSLTAAHGDIVVAELENSFTVKQLIMKKGEAWLAPANPSYSAVRVDNTDVRIVGVVTSGINRFRE